MRVGVVGAGSIGRFVAVRLAASGAEVVLVSPHVPAPEALAAVEVGGRRVEPGPGLSCSRDASALAEVDVCLVAVKSAATEAVAASLAEVLSAEAPVVSLQNGLRNVERLRARLGDRAVGGVVSYNVFLDGEVAHQASKGVLLAGMLRGIGGHRLRQLRAVFRRAGETLGLRDDIDAVIAGKLLLNLNNGICAATGLSISESLRSRDARWCFARCLREGIAVMRAADLRPARVTIVPPRLIAALMVLPDEVVLRVARAIVDVDPRARSSTLQDLDRGRPTEIDELNGAIAWLAERAGIGAPINGTVAAIVHDHEAEAIAGRTPRYLTAGALRERLRN
jgi:2-dehydropantoate 2-reductase